MNTTIREEDGKIIVVLEGRLDTAAAAKTSVDIAPVNESEGHDIVIDCTGLTYISSSGLRILLGIRKHASEVSSRVSITGANDDIRDVLYTTGFNNLFEIL